MGPDTLMLPCVEGLGRARPLLPHAEMEDTHDGECPGARKARVELATAQRAEPEVGTAEENPTWLPSLLCFSELPGQAGCRL